MRKTQKRFRVEQLSKNQYPCLFTTWRTTRYISYCRFAREVTAAMLVVKNKSISLTLGNKLHFHVNFSKKIFVWTTNVAALSRGSKTRISMVVNDKLYSFVFCFGLNV